MKAPLIIDRPDLQAWQQKAVFGALTAAIWVAWIFLWMPLITLLGWVFFGYQFQFHMLDLDGYKGFLNLLIIYGVVVIGMGGALVLWAIYNHIRFRGVDRRHASAPPTSTEIAAWIDHPSSAVNAWRSYAIMTVHHDDHGGITRVDPSEADTDAPCTHVARAPLLESAG